VLLWWPCLGQAVSSWCCWIQDLMLWDSRDLISLQMLASLASLCASPGYCSVCGCWTASPTYCWRYLTLWPSSDCGFWTFGPVAVYVGLRLAFQSCLVALQVPREEHLRPAVNPCFAELQVPLEEPLLVPATSFVAEEFGVRSDKLIKSSSGPLRSEGEWLFIKELGFHSRHFILTFVKDALSKGSKNFYVLKIWNLFGHFVALHEF
jgi:hypothetical protein